MFLAICSLRLFTPVLRHCVRSHRARNSHVIRSFSGGDLTCSESLPGLERELLYEKTTRSSTKNEPFVEGTRAFCFQAFGNETVGLSIPVSHPVCCHIQSGFVEYWLKEKCSSSRDKYAKLTTFFFSPPPCVKTGWQLWILNLKPLFWHTGWCVRC